MAPESKHAFDLPYTAGMPRSRSREHEDSIVPRPPSFKDSDWAQKIALAKQARAQGRELRKGKAPGFDNRVTLLRQTPAE